MVSADSDSEYNEPVDSQDKSLFSFLRQYISEPRVCQYSCGGTQCKYERADLWPSSSKAIKGLYSHWITDRVLAMARPTNACISALKQAKIRTILNLQVGGEHENCGLGGLIEDFSYNPTEFIQKDIDVVFYPIKDYRDAPFDYILSICRKMRQILGDSDGKIAVHCHAGLGRTDKQLVFFEMCNLILDQGITCDEAIKLVRQIRPGSIQSKLQIKAMENFEKNVLWTFGNLYPFGEYHRHYLSKLLKSQNVRFNSNISIPLIPQICSERILQLLSNNNNSVNEEWLDYNFEQAKDTIEKLLLLYAKTEFEFKKFQKYKNSLNTSSDIETLIELKESKDKELLCNLFLGWYGNLGRPILTKRDIVLITDKWSSGSRWSYMKFDLKKEQQNTIKIIVDLYSKVLYSTNSRKYLTQIVDCIYCLLTLTHNYCHVENQARWPLIQQLGQPLPIRIRNIAMAAIKHWFLHR